MGLMKQLLMDIQSSLRFKEAAEAERQKILQEWWETDEYRELKKKLAQNKDRNEEDTYKKPKAN